MVKLNSQPPSQMVKKALFLHMGPGFHSRVEAEVLGPKFPEVDFWNQPLASEESGAFKKLIDHAAIQLRQLFAANNGTPIRLIGHSFGGQIAKYLVAHEPQMVDRMVLFNSAVDPYFSFVELAKALAKSQICEKEKAQQLIEAAALAEKKREWNRLVHAVGHIASTERFQELYWLNVTKCQDYMKIARKYPPLHLDSFINVFSDYVSNYDPSQFCNIWQGDVRISWSSGDVLAPTKAAYTDWSRIFPKAKICEIERVGHFAHFESDANVFLK